MAGKTVHEVSGFRFRKPEDAKIVEKFERIARRECENNLHDAFRKVVLQYKENGKEK